MREIPREIPEPAEAGETEEIGNFRTLEEALNKISSKRPEEPKSKPFTLTLIFYFLKALTFRLIFPTLLTCFLLTMKYLYPIEDSRYYINALHAHPSATSGPLYTNDSITPVSVYNTNPVLHVHRPFNNIFYDYRRASILMIAGGLILFLNGFFIRPNEKIIKTDKRNHIAMEIDVAYACLYKMPKEFKNTIRTIKLWRNWLMLLTFLAWFFGGAGLFIEAILMHSSSDGFRYNPIGDVVSNGLRCQFSSGQPRSFSTSVPLFDDITIKFKSQITNTLGIQTNPYISFSSTSFLSLHVYNYPCTGKAYDLGLIYRNVNLGEIPYLAAIVYYYQALEENFHCSAAAESTEYKLTKFTRSTYVVSDDCDDIIESINGSYNGGRELLVFGIVWLAFAGITGVLLCWEVKPWYMCYKRNWEEEFKKTQEMVETREIKRMEETGRVDGKGEKKGAGENMMEPAIELQMEPAREPAIDPEMVPKTSLELRN